MHSSSNSTHQKPDAADALSATQLVNLVAKQEREIVNLRRQVAWFQRQIFGQKSEKRHPEPDAKQGVLGFGFDAVPGTLLPGKKTVVPAHKREREPKPKHPNQGADALPRYCCARQNAQHTRCPASAADRECHTPCWPFQTLDWHRFPSFAHRHISPGQRFLQRQCLRTQHLPVAHLHRHRIARTARGSPAADWVFRC